MSFLTRNKIYESFTNIILYCFIGLIPYKILSLLNLPFHYRICLGIFFLMVFFYQMKALVLKCLNSFLIQTFVYRMLVIEEYLLSRPLGYQYFLAIVFGLNVGLWSTKMSDPVFTLALVGFVFSLYSNFKRVFLNPSFEGNLYRNGNTDPKISDMSWDIILKNVSRIAVILFQGSVENRLSPVIGAKRFPNVVRRYMWRRVSGPIRDTLKQYPEAASGVSALVGFFVGETFQRERHREAEENSQRRHDESIKMQREALIEQRRANDIADAQLEQQRRANDIAEKAQSSNANGQSPGLSCSYEPPLTFSELIENFFGKC